VAAVMMMTQIKARRHYLRNYGRCFAGSRAVDWCLANAKSSSRQEAILSMTTLLQKGTLFPPLHAQHDQRTRDATQHTHTIKSILVVHTHTRHTTHQA
jgi:LPS sulfotransferase NodH